jgi:tetratricopeptide (TPR) repeat protein
MRRLLLIFALAFPAVCLPSAGRLYAQDAKSLIDRGDAWTDKGEYDKAIADYNLAIKRAPNNYRAYNERGNAWAWKGEFDKAIVDYNQAIRLNPSNAVAYCNRGDCWREKGDNDKALADYNRSLRLDPNDPITYYRRGVLWSDDLEFDQAITCPVDKYRDGKQALVNANRAHELSKGQDWSVMDTLAAVHAENGDFKLAREWAAKALDMAKKEKDKADVRARLKLYQQDKPFRDEPKQSELPRLVS